MFGVDRKEDVKKIEEIIKNDPIQNGYYARIVKS
jgi:hypothetical protein